MEDGLIEAYWNVNYFEIWQDIGDAQFNRSILKCKFLRWISGLLARQGLIEAYWNVNTTKGVGDSDLAMFNRSILKCKLYREE